MFILRNKRFVCLHNNLFAPFVALFLFRIYKCLKFHSGKMNEFCDDFNVFT